MKRRLYLISILILLAGMGSSLVIYFMSGNDTGRVLGYDMMGGEVYPVNPDDSKMYRHDLEVYGGKANVLMDKLTRWFEGLWHGKSLALTITCLAAVSAITIFLVAYHWQSGPDSDTAD